MKIKKMYPFIKGTNINICKEIDTFECEIGFPRGSSADECLKYVQKEDAETEKMYKKLHEDSVENGYEIETFCDCCEYCKYKVELHSLYCGQAKDIPIRLADKQVKAIRLYKGLNSRRKEEIQGIEIEVVR